MTVLIGSWEFEGPFDKSNELRAEPGLCAILHTASDNLELVEIEETDSVRKFIERHKTYHFSDRMPAHKFAVAVYYCSDLTSSLRAGLIDEVLKEFDKQCAIEEQWIAHPAPLSQAV
jgi:hypothetical protein